MYVGVDVGTSISPRPSRSARTATSSTARRSRPVCCNRPRPRRAGHRRGALLGQRGVGRAGRQGRRARARRGTGQGDGLWLVDAAGRPVRAAVSWMDGRAAETVRRWTDSGVEEALFRVNGNIQFPGSPAAIMSCLDEHEPGSLDRAATAGYCKDVVLQSLTGVRATDVSDSSMPFSDPRGGYSAEALAAAGLSHRADLLAPIGDSFGELHAAGAAATGIAAGTPVVAGPYDLPACARGAGVVDPGDGMVIIGTTLACQVVRSEVDTTGRPAGLTLATGMPGRWLRAMPAMVGTASLDWALRTLGATTDALPEMLGSSPVGANGVAVLPYFAPSGERAPFVDPFARGQISGLTLRSTQADLVRAVCAGIAYAARHCLEAAGFSGSLAVAGGGSRSHEWLQIFADVLGCELRLPRSSEVGARGAVVNGLSVLGRAVDEAAWTESAEVVSPSEDRSHYAEGYQRYRVLLAAAEPLWRPVFGAVTTNFRSES